jgi:hypothetical protein
VIEEVFRMVEGDKGPEKKKACELRREGLSSTNTLIGLDHTIRFIVGMLRSRKCRG